ncbi:MAG: hypothetical protein HOP12_09975 [Candidatus Eisenbacteria bacterium]|uniref:Transcription elongation factor GreA n=1 Tax=Eiseniibacteriota bacterium TaxID=2212470 RepID=A0A849SPB7_UNCEI|nr:hypothetical protein [Candidatus Eisenbacteria bacterium]
MALRDELSVILRGDACGDLSPASRERLESLAANAAETGALVSARDECASRLRQGSATHAVDYLLAAVCAHHGEIERANQTLLALGEKLAQAKSWEPLAAISDRSLGLEETGAGARLLVRAHEAIGKEPDRVQALRRAWAILPDDLDLGLQLAVRLLDVGEAAERRVLLAELTPRFALEKRYGGLEEAALEFAEHDDVEGLARLVQVLPTLALQGAFKESRQLADIALPRLVAAGRATELVDPLRKALAAAAEAGGEKAAKNFREPLVTALREGPGRSLPDAAGVIADSGLEDSEISALAALERYDLLAALPAGRSVFHGSFGAGRVVSNDADVVVLDFPKSRGHRMPYAAARRTLTPLDEGDLRLLLLQSPDQLKRMFDEEHAEVMVRSLKALGGKADAQGLKVFLVGYQLLPATEWTSFFRKAKSAAEKDVRIDHSRAFEQVWALADEDAEIGAMVEVPLPPLEPRKPVRSNLITLKKFLTQHPGAELALTKRFGRYVMRAMQDPEGERADRARAGLYFARWNSTRSPEWIEVLKTLWEQGLSITDLSGEDEQIALLEASHAAGVEADALLSALDSRYAAVRERAQGYREHLDEAGREALRRTLLDHAARYPAAALRMVEIELAKKLPPEDGWRILWSALALVEERPKPSTAEKVLGWIEIGGLFDRMLAGQPCGDEQRMRLTVLLRQWRSSDRYLFPALEIAARLGLHDAVAAVRASREQSTQRMFAQVGQQTDTELSVMTRATWERQKKELERMERELRTTIPAAIQKARELGDLKENAEYHSAKLKQQTISQQVANLQLRLSRARFVDDAPSKPGVVGLGTEVMLESEGGSAMYWILGEGEQHHGDHVISFQSVVGRSLLGKNLGDEVELEIEGAVRRFKVKSVERKVPPHAAETGEPVL